MPPIRYLHCVGQSLCYRHAVAASSISRDDFDLTMLLQPSTCRRWFAVRQKLDWPASLKVADYGAIAVISSPCPIIDADDLGRREREPAAAPDRAKQGVIADRCHQSVGKARARAAAESQPQVQYELLETGGATRPWQYDAAREAFRKNPLLTLCLITDKPASLNDQADGAAAEGEISGPPYVATVDLGRGRPAPGAPSSCLPGTGHDLRGRARSCDHLH
jgi:hypothetical protein